MLGLTSRGRLLARLGALISALALTLGLSAAAASATEIPGIVTGFSFVQNESPLNTRVEASMTFAIPDSAVEGDTSTITLDGPLLWVAMSFPIIDTKTGEVVANATVSGNTLVLTFTDYVDRYQSVTGEAAVWLAFDRSKVAVGDTVTGSVTSSTTFTDTIVVGPPTTLDNSGTVKRMYWVDPTTQTSLAFVIYVSTVGLVANPNGSVVVTDTPTGSTVDCASLRLPGAIKIAPDVNGAPGKWAPVPAAQVTITCPAPSSPNGFTVSLTGIAADQHLRISGTATPGAVQDSYVNKVRVVAFGGEPRMIEASTVRVGGTGLARGVPVVTPPPTTQPPTTPAPSTTPPVAPSSPPAPPAPELAETGAGDGPLLAISTAFALIALGLALTFRWTPAASAERRH